MDPVRDIGIIRHELIQKDIDWVSKRVKEMGRKAAKSQDKLVREEFDLLKKAESVLSGDEEIRNTNWSDR